MALIVEDGTGLSNAESYISVVDASTYHSSRNNTTWTGIDSVLEAALRRATEYIDLVYRTQWQGRRILEAQALDFPRYGVVDSDGYTLASTEVPIGIIRATAELALRALTDDILPDVKTPGTLKVELVEMPGPLKRLRRYEGGSQTKKYSEIDLLVQEYLENGSSFPEAERG